VCSLFFRSGGGRPHHNILIFIFRILTGGSTLRFTISSTRAFLNILPDVLLLPRRSYFCRSRSLFPLKPTGFARHLFTKVRPFWVLGRALSLPCPLHRTGTARRVNILEGRPTTLGPTIALGPFLRLTAALYFYMRVPIPLILCSKRFHFSLSLRDPLTLRIRLFLLDLPPDP
jgi:hypothetical protein